MSIIPAAVRAASVMSVAHASACMLLVLGVACLPAGMAVAQTVPGAQYTQAADSGSDAVVPSASQADTETYGAAPTFPGQGAPGAASPGDADVVRVLLSAELETTLVAMMAGRIASLPVQLGQHLHKGELVAAMDCAEPEARLHMAKAELAAANSTLGVKSRLRKLDAAGDVEVSLAAADADRARAALEMARIQADHCNIEAPFDGRVVRLLASPHQGVAAGTALVEMIGDGPLKLRLNIPSHWLRHVRQGTRFQVKVHETGLSYPAHITHVNARVDAVAQTIELEARMDNSEPELLAGMSGVAVFGSVP